MARKKSTFTFENFVQIAFTLFIVLQTPCVVIDSKPDYTVSPYVVSVAFVAEKFPDYEVFFKAALFPGNWMREAFVPYLVCMIATPTLEECQPYMEKLWDPYYIMYRADLVTPKQWVEENVTKERELFITACMFITGLGLCSYLIPLRISIFGFIFLTFAVLKAEVIPMPPFLGMSFIVGLVGFYFSGQRQKALETSKEKAKGPLPESDATENAASAKKD